MNHLSLFSGIGGIDLAAEWAGMTTVAFVEQNKFCQKVLAKHWPNVPIFDDVKTLTKDDISEPIDIISGGFPCQPFSVAGSQLGAKDDRHLWPQYLRIIQEFRPAWIVGENVVGIISMELDNVLADLESIGYSARAFDIPAASIGASHERRRVFIVANSNHIRRKRISKEQILRTENMPFQPMRVVKVKPGGQYLSQSVTSGSNDGVQHRTHRLKSLGNAVVPQQIYPIMQAIADIERITA